SADILMHSVNFADIVALQKAGRWDLAAEALTDSARRLEAAGAACAPICTNTMHPVAPEGASGTGTPPIHRSDETAAALRANGPKRPLRLATRYAVEHGFYAQRMRGFGIEVMVPDAEGRTVMHDIIFGELCAGIVREASREAAVRMIEVARAA